MSATLPAGHARSLDETGRAPRRETSKLQANATTRTPTTWDAGSREYGQWYDAGMDRERVIELLQEHDEEIRAFGVTELYLFGSVARGEASTSQPALCCGRK